MTFLLFLGLLVAILLSGYFSGMETGYYSLNKYRLELRAEDGDPAARRLLQHLARPAWLMTVVLLGTNLSVDLATHLGEAFLLQVLSLERGGGGVWIYLLNTLFLTPLLFLFGEVLPKVLFRAAAETLTYRFSSGISLAGAVLSPLILILALPARLAIKLARGGGGVLSPLAGKEGLRALLGKKGGKGSTLSRVQAELAGRLVDLNRVEVGHVMVPLKKVALARLSWTRKTFLEWAGKLPYSRFPVQGPGGPADLAGYVYLLDLLYDPRPDCPLKDHLRRLVELPAEAPLDQGLLTLQRKKARIALVRGRGGEPLGIVTVQDLWEEIVGDWEREGGKL